MRVRYSFSSRRTRKIGKIRKQRPKYPDLLKKIVEDSQIILEILDARFPEETRNHAIEEEIIQKNKKIIYVLNKSDLTTKKNIKNFDYLSPKVIISCKERFGIKELRDLLKKISKKIDSEKVFVGVVGYPNTGKSSLLNILVGKSSAGVGSDAGFTKGLQKIKLTEKITLIDSPGVIPKEKYSSKEKKKIAEHTIVGGRSYTQVKEPEMVIHNIMKSYPGILEEHYKIKAEGDSELLIENFGKKNGFMKRGGKVNEDKAARQILKDWQMGEIKI
jgi:ribosome biogenesis GTPase A